MKGEPKPISASEQRLRLQRIVEISSELGFVGIVEYRHAYSQSGGAQYCIGPTQDDDIMILHAEAFERDAKPDDFPLDAMIAHECGHQRLHRDPKLQEVRAKFPGDTLEEILASVVGAVLLGGSDSAQPLRLKASAELTDLRLTADYADGFVKQLEKKLRQLL